MHFSNIGQWAYVTLESVPYREGVLCLYHVELPVYSCDGLANVLKFNIVNSLWDVFDTYQGDLVVHIEGVTM